MAVSKVRHKPTYLPGAQAKPKQRTQQRPDSRASVRSLAHQDHVAKSEERIMAQSGMRDGTFNLGVAFNDHSHNHSQTPIERPSTANKFVDDFLSKESKTQHNQSSTRMLKQLQEARQLHSSSGRRTATPSRRPMSGRPSSGRPLTGNKHVDALLPGTRPRSSKRPSTAGSVRPGSTAANRLGTAGSTRPLSSQRPKSQSSQVSRGRALSRAGVIGTLRPWSRTSHRSDIMVVHRDDRENQNDGENDENEANEFEAGEQDAGDGNNIQENDDDEEELTEAEEFRLQQMTVNADTTDQVQERFIYNSQERVQRAHDAVDRLTSLFKGTTTDDKERARQQMRGSVRLGTNYGRDTPASDSPANHVHFQTTKDTFDAVVRKSPPSLVPALKSVRNETSSGMIGVLSPRVLELEQEQGHTLDISQHRPGLHNPWKASLAHTKSLRHTKHHKGTYDTTGAEVGAHTGIKRRELSVFHHAKAINNIELHRAPEDRIPIRSESRASYSDPMDFGLDLANPVVNNKLWESTTFW